MTSAPATMSVCATCRLPLSLETANICLVRFSDPKYNLLQFRCDVEFCGAVTSVFCRSIPPDMLELFSIIGLEASCLELPPAVVAGYERLRGQFEYL